MRIKSFAVFAAAAAAVLKAASGQAADVTWTNGSGDFLWNTSSPNFTAGAWNNSAGDGAVFDAAGAGVITVGGPINVDSMNFVADGYTLNGAGPITFVPGSSTQTTGVVRVGTSAAINVPVNSSVGFQKVGLGVLELNAPGSFTGVVPIDPRGTLNANLLVGGVFGTLSGGTLRPSADAIPATTSVSIGNGYLDIGSNNQVLSKLTFTNQVPSGTWNATLNANNGVIGTGTLRVAGEIFVQGVTGDNFGNSIASNFDLGGGTQVIHIGVQSAFTLNKALMFTGVVSNGSLLKTLGTNANGVFVGTTDGISLFGNNTYTGATVLNAGQSVATGTNATTSIKIAGLSGGFGGSQFSLQGANGSAQSATLIQAVAGGNFILDNNASTGGVGTLNFDQPNVPAAQNNDRIRDDAVVELRDGTFTLRSLSNNASSETYGSLNLAGGHNTLTVTATGTLGTASLTAAGNLTMALRSTMLINAGTLLADRSRAYFNGAIPTADATGILPRIVSTNDFVTYNGTTGMTPYTGYATDFSTAGTNVAITAAATVASSVNINALKRTGSFALTIDPAATLGITSGMILNTSGTGTITGGTIAFGSNPGVLFGTNNISSAITGSAGLIHASGTGTLSGDLSGLSGSIDVLSGTTNLNTNTFTGPINVRTATLNLNVNQMIGAGLGPITLGVAQNDENLVPLNPTLGISGAGANAVFDRDIIVDNGAKTVAGKKLRYPLAPGISALSNSTGSQTFNGDITLNTSIRLQGGGASATSTGATVFNGDISGPGIFYMPNGRAIFNGNYSNAGGFDLGDQGFSMKAFFMGTGSGNGTMEISGGNGNTVSYEAGALQGGRIRVWNSSTGTQPQIIPLENSTINNEIFLDSTVASGGGDVNGGNVTANVGTAITATWAGPISGQGGLTKTGAGELILSSDASTHNGFVRANVGTLTARRLVNQSLVAVAAGATLRISPGGAVGDPIATSVFGEDKLLIDGGPIPTGRVDVAKNGIVLDYNTVSPESTVRSQIAAGFAGSTWTGQGITSADAALDPTGHVVGYAAAADIGSPSTFLGQPVDGTTVLVRYTRNGDADLSGTTDIGDFALLGANFNNPGKWVTGDFNYDGTTDIGDFALLAANFNQAAAGNLPRGAAVPEPSVALAVSGLALLMAARRRRVG